MLFLLTGDVQIGKTRWLERLLADLQRKGVTPYGVLAPGVWVPSDAPEANAQGFEKLGIDNVLLPQNERLRFANRIDLAKRDGTYDENAQAGRMGLGWHISDEAIEHVNAHLASIPKLFDEEKGQGLLVIDELGRLELHKGEGLVEAMRLLDEGPRPGLDNAVLIVRETLVDEAEARYAEAWDGACRIAPDGQGRARIESALGLTNS